METFWAIVSWAVVIGGAALGGFVCWYWFVAIPDRVVGRHTRAVSATVEATEQTAAARVGRPVWR